VAREVQRFAVTVPAGTAKAGALIFNLPMPPRIVDEVEILIPPGPRGEVGFQLASGGAQIIPVTAGAFEVTDNEVIHWPLEGQIDSGAWQMIAYNTGAFNHLLQVRFLVRLVPAAAALAGFQPLPVDSLTP
jgi:hypothetical protein